MSKAPEKREFWEQIISQEVLDMFAAIGRNRWPVEQLLDDYKPVPHVMTIPKYERIKAQEEKSER